MITKALLKQIREDFKEVVKPLEEKYGMELKLGSISYSDLQFTAKVEGSFTKDGLTPEQTKFNTLCHRYGFIETDYGRIFTHKGAEYELCGFAPNRRKYPVVARSRVNQKEYCFVLDEVKQRLN